MARRATEAENAAVSAVVMSEVVALLAAAPCGVSGAGGGGTVGGDVAAVARPEYSLLVLGFASALVDCVFAGLASPKLPNLSTG